MKQFFVVKTGLETLDLCRAYGLAKILEKLKDNGKEVILRDVGFYYLIESPEVNIQKKKEALALVPTKILLSKDIGKTEARWDQVLRTCKIPGDPMKKTKLKGFKEILKKDIKIILKRYSKLQWISEFERNKDIPEVLYGTIEPTAFKGIRDIKRGKRYSEGGPYKINSQDLILSFIGAAEASIWVLGKDGSIAIFGKPGQKGINIDSLRAIRKNIINQIRFHRGGVLPTLVWTALCLSYEIKKFQTEKLFKLFNDLYFNVLRWTGNQPKPEKGGKFSLKFLNDLSVQLKEDEFFDLMETWISLFQISNRPGFENLAITLADFITNQTLSNFEQYIKTHLHLYLNPKTKKQFIYKKVDDYNQKLITNLAKYVSIN